MQKRFWILVLTLIALMVAFLTLQLREPSSLDLPSTPPIHDTGNKAQPQANEKPKQISNSLQQKNNARNEIAITINLDEQLKQNLGKLIGRVVETDGTPVPHFKVEAYTIDLDTLLPDQASWFAEEKFLPSFIAASTSTDENGVFELNDLNPKAWFGLGLDLQGERPSIRFVDNTPGPGETVHLGDIILDPIITFLGRIVDEKKQPISGARVRASNLPFIAFQAGVAEIKPGSIFLWLEKSDKRAISLPKWLANLIERFPIPTTYSDAEGHFRLDGVQPGSSTVMVDITNRPVVIQGPITTPKSGESNLGDIVVSDGENLEGKVIDQTGKPVANVEVFAGPKSPMAPVAILHSAGKTDSEGKFTAIGLSENENYAASRFDAASPWGYSEAAIPGFDQTNIVLERGFDVNIQVKTEVDQPIQQIEFLLKSAEGAEEFPLFFTPVPLQGKLSKTESGWQIQGLTSGKYLLLAKAPNYGLHKEEFHIDNAATSVVMSLQKAHSTAIQVLDEKIQSPIFAARVSLHSVDAKEWSIALAAANTNAEGMAQLHGLEAGNYRIQVSHARYGTTTRPISVPLPDDSATIVTLQPGGSLQGLVHEGGNPLQQPRALALNFSGGKNFTSMPRMVITDLAGNYQVNNLEPGEYEIIVMPRFFNSSLFDLQNILFEQSLVEQQTNALIQSGEITQLNIDIKENDANVPGGKLQGFIEVNHKPIEGLRIAAWNASRKLTHTDSNGFFVFEKLPVGQGVIQISQPTANNQWEDIELGSYNIEIPENEIVEKRWKIFTGRVQGRILRNETKTGTYARINVQIDVPDDEQNLSFSLPSDVGGNFLIEPARTGKWSLQAEGQNLISEQITFELKEGEHKDFLEILLNSAVSISGKLVFSPPLTEDTRWVWLRFNATNKLLHDQSARVNEKDLSFSCDNLIPGQYTVEAISYQKSDEHIQWEKTSLVIPQGGLDNVVLSFAKKPVQENQEQQDE